MPRVAAPGETHGSRCAGSPTRRSVWPKRALTIPRDAHGSSARPLLAAAGKAMSQHTLGEGWGAVFEPTQSKYYYTQGTSTQWEWPEDDL